MLWGFHIHCELEPEFQHQTAQAKLLPSIKPGKSHKNQTDLEKTQLQRHTFGLSENRVPQNSIISKTNNDNSTKCFGASHIVPLFKWQVDAIYDSFMTHKLRHLPNFGEEIGHLLPPRSLGLRADRGISGSEVCDGHLLGRQGWRMASVAGQDPKNGISLENVWCFRERMRIDVHRGGIGSQHSPKLVLEPNISRKTQQFCGPPTTSTPGLDSFVGPVGLPSDHMDLAMVVVQRDSKTP